MPPPSRVTGCVLSNELIDAFPVHRVVRTGDELSEVYVAVDAAGDSSTSRGRFQDAAIARYFDDLRAVAGRGCYAEVNLDAAQWVSDVATSLERGCVLTFDYGYEAADLYAPWRRDGTLLCLPPVGEQRSVPAHRQARHDGKRRLHDAAARGRGGGGLRRSP